jgi:hypothetical protein
VDGSDPNGDQAHHFGFFFVQGAGLANLSLSEAALAIVGMSVGVEVLNAFRDRKFNVPDMHVGVAAGMMGYFANRSILGLDSPMSSQDIGATMRTDLCK